MRNGDFSEVLAVNPASASTIRRPAPTVSAGRSSPGAVIPGRPHRAVAQKIQALYPAPNNAGHEQRAAEQPVPPRAPEGRSRQLRRQGQLEPHRRRIRSSRSSRRMQAKVDDLFYARLRDVGGGDTQVYVGTVGHTWTISPTMVLDGNVGMNKQNQPHRAATSAPTSGLDDFGLPGTNGPDPRQSGMPSFDIGIEHRSATTPDWTPLERARDAATRVTANLTKLIGAHEIRTGFDFIRYQLNHWQPELGSGPRGDFSFSGNVTGAPGYTSQPVEPVRRRSSSACDTGYGKSVQYRGDDAAAKISTARSSATAGTCPRS